MTETVLAKKSAPPRNSLCASRSISFALLLAFALGLMMPAMLRAQIDDATRQLSRKIFQQLIEINTTDSVGSTTIAAQAMADRLLAAGYPAADVFVGGPTPKKGNMVVRLHGTGARKPLLMMCHLDVVEARREDWSVDPFRFLEKNGYFYGRGTSDVKDGDAILMTMMLRFKKEGYKPDRDLILALTADEEGGDYNGVDWLLRNHRDLIDAEYILNPDAGNFESENGKKLLLGIEASEKLYADYTLEVTDNGGHSSEPTSKNAIYHLADGLVKLQHFQFPFELNDVTREYFKRKAAIEGGEAGAQFTAILKTPPDQAAIAKLSESPFYNARIRTTCVATRLDGGHAYNALPQMARANINCRILPGHSAEEVRQQLAKVVDDPQISIAERDRGRALLKINPTTHLGTEMISAIEKVRDQMWPGVPVMPEMDAGASDGAFTRAEGITTYGVPGVFSDINDDRAHGRDERVEVKEFYAGVDFYYRLVKILSTKN
jgi:acetylornithine deacetylase/succinyl-diaminopimelate desuccinylase-like protein